MNQAIKHFPPRDTAYTNEERKEREQSRKDLTLCFSHFSIHDERYRTTS